MFKKLLAFFSGEEESLAVDQSGTVSGEEVHVAVSVLLLEIAGRDGDYAPEEVKRIFSVMEQHFSLSKDEVRQLLDYADKLRQNTKKIDEFVRVINERFNETQRIKILAMVWAVIQADGLLEKEEARFAEQIRNRLRLTPDQAKCAEAMAAQGDLG